MSEKTKEASKLERIFSKRNVVLLAVLWIAFNLLFHFGPWSTSALAKVSGGKGIPDLMSYDLHKLQDLFAAYGPQGIEIYKNLQLLDFLYPLIYAALLLGLLVRLKLPNSFKVLYSYPFVIIFFDYSENLIIRHLINLYPNLTEAQSHLAKLGNFCTLLKWSNIGALVILILGIWIWNRFRKK